MTKPLNIEETIMKKYNDITQIHYEGPSSVNPYAFKYYNPKEIIMGKPMKDHLRFSMAYWHTITGDGKDPFGDKTIERAWDQADDEIAKAKARVDVAFDMMQKLGIEYFCIHDRDVAPEQDSLEDTNRVLDEVIDLIESKMQETNIKLLWGTANLFRHKRFVHGASTSPNADVFAYAAAQAKKAIEITKRLKGEGFVFWGGREGYETLLNTNMKLEQDNFARFLRMAVDYAKSIGFTGQFYIEPKPKEPTKHQYDYDCATVIGFLRHYGLDRDFKLNIETNHATLAMHTINHELRLAADHGMLGSVDANQGDLLLGWDTDQFPTNIYDAVSVMYEIVRAGGFTTGGLNFDAKVRRGSYTDEDLLLAHIAGMDTYAAGLRIACRLWGDGVFEDHLRSRYAAYETGIGKQIIEGNVGFPELEKYVMDKKTLVENESGRQEYLEAVLNQYIIGS
jgi:xylose isomerase